MFAVADSRENYHVITTAQRMLQDISFLKGNKRKLFWFIHLNNELIQCNHLQQQ